MQNAHRLRKEAPKPVGQRGVVCQSTLARTAAEEVSELIALGWNGNRIHADTTADGFAGSLTTACQAADIPPFTLIAWPVIFEAAGLARNTANGAISAGVTTPSFARLSAF